MTVPTTDPAARVQALAYMEACVWLALLAMTGLVMSHTVASEFPAREVALLGEGVVALVCVALAGWARHGQRRAAQIDPRWLPLVGGLAVFRMVVLVPVVLFAVAVAAAGFTA